MVYSYNPVIEIGQLTQGTHAFRLVDVNERPYEGIDLSGATDVSLTMEHRNWGTTVIAGESVDIVDAPEGDVEYTFSSEETELYGDHYIQFEIEWSGGDTELVPPSGYDWTISVGRRLPRSGRDLSVRRLTADDIYTDLVQATAVTAEEATVETLSVLNQVVNLSAESLDAETLSVESLDAETLSAQSFGDIASAFGGGFVIDDQGRLAVALEDVGSIEGATIPLTQNLPLANYDIEGPGRAGTAENPLTEMHSGSVTIGNGDTATGTEELTSLSQIETLEAGGKPLTGVREVAGLFVNAGEFDTIQDAVWYARDNGIGTVWIPEGRYEETVTLGQDNRGITLHGENKLNTIIDGGSGAGIVSDVFHSTIENLRIETDADTGGQGIDLVSNLNRYNRIKNVLITECGDQGIATDNTFTRIESCDVRACANEEIYLGSNSEHCIVDGCWVEGEISNARGGDVNRISETNIEY